MALKDYDSLSIRFCLPLSPDDSIKSTWEVMVATPIALWHGSIAFDLDGRVSLAHSHFHINQKGVFYLASIARVTGARRALGGSFV